MGGDEFTVIGHYASDAILEKKEKMIHDHLRDFSIKNDFPMEVKASIAYAASISDNISDIEALTHLADKRMYAIKQEHHKGS